MKKQWVHFVSVVLITLAMSIGGCSKKIESYPQTQGDQQLEAIAQPTNPCQNGFRSTLQGLMKPGTYATLKFDSAFRYAVSGKAKTIYKIPFSNKASHTDFVLVAFDSAGGFVKGNIVNLNAVNNLAVDEVFTGSMTLTSLDERTTTIVPVQDGFDTGGVIPDSPDGAERVSQILIVVGQPSYSPTTWLNILYWLNFYHHGGVYAPIGPVPPGGGIGGGVSSGDPCSGIPMDVVNGTDNMDGSDNVCPESFKYKTVVSADVDGGGWQIAAVSNLHITVVDFATRKALVVLLPTMYFGMPIQRTNGIYYSPSYAAQLSAEAVELAERDVMDKYHSLSPTTPAGMIVSTLNSYFKQRLQFHMRNNYYGSCGQTPGSITAPLVPTKARYAGFFGC